MTLSPLTAEHVSQPAAARLIPVVACGPSTLPMVAWEAMPKNLRWVAYWYEAPHESSDGRGRGMLIAAHPDDMYSTHTLAHDHTEACPPDLQGDADFAGNREWLRRLHGRGMCDVTPEGTLRERADWLILWDAVDRAMAALRDSLSTADAIPTIAPPT